MSTHEPDGSAILQAHGFRARIMPAVGSILASLDWHAPSGKVHPLLFSPQGSVPTTDAPNFLGAWAMVPFANRAFDCLIDDGTQCFMVPVNDPAKTGNIHGFGWQSPWNVTEKTSNRLVTAHQRSGADDPYVYEAAQTVTLLADHVRLDLSVTNHADRALPFGLGFHPWFACASDTSLMMSSRSALVLGPGYRATGRTDFADGGPFSAGRIVRDLAGELALSYVGWVGDAVFSTPSHGLSISIGASDSFCHPVLWSPPGADFVCFEPQSHGIGAPGNAMARSITPLARLEPGETLSGWMTIMPHEVAHLTR